MPLELGIVFWHWWVLGVALLIFELLAPGVFFLWIGLSAFVVGAIAALLPILSWQYQLFLFSVLSIVSVVLWRIYLNKHPIKTDRPLLNRRSAQYIGRVFTLEEPIVNRRGKIKVDDSIWKIEGEDCPAHTQVKVVSVNGVVLQVKRLTE
jgi:inner membrane protein